jgi:hypothetical protein
MAMRSRVELLLGIAIAIVASGATAIPTRSAATQIVPLRELPAAKTDCYKVDPYIDAATRLRAVGKERAIRALIEHSKALPFEDTGKVVVLCRMLFAPKELPLCRLPTNSTDSARFRRPALGAPLFVGDKHDVSEWRLEPIEVIDGVPFLITKGYWLGGFPEFAGDYVRYCVENCDWNDAKYSPKARMEKERSLEKLLGYLKSRGKVKQDDEKFLSSQIQ